MIIIIIVYQLLYINSTRLCQSLYNYSYLFIEGDDSSSVFVRLTVPQQVMQILYHSLNYGSNFKVLTLWLCTMKVPSKF